MFLSRNSEVNVTSKAPAEMDSAESSTNSDVEDTPTENRSTGPSRVNLRTAGSGNKITGFATQCLGNENFRFGNPPTSATSKASPSKNHSDGSADLDLCTEGGTDNEINGYAATCLGNGNFRFFSPA